METPGKNNIKLASNVLIIIQTKGTTIYSSEFSDNTVKR